MVIRRNRKLQEIYTFVDMAFKLVLYVYSFFPSEKQIRFSVDFKS